VGRRGGGAEGRKSENGTSSQIDFRTGIGKHPVTQAYVTQAHGKTWRFRTILDNHEKGISIGYHSNSPSIS
jgi:hypothetical protein